MRCMFIARLAALTIATSVASSAATLSITPEQTTYAPGDTIVLNIFGDSEGEETETQGIFGRLLFDPNRASYVSSSQQPLVTQFGITTWVQGGLSGGVEDGVGFADAFNQFIDFQQTTSVPLIATVQLVAEATGVLDLDWLLSGEGDPSHTLRFFSVTSHPGTSVLIIPEPSTISLIALGLLVGAGGLALLRRPRS